MTTILITEDEAGDRHVAIALEGMTLALCILPRNKRMDFDRVTNLRLLMLLADVQYIRPDGGTTNFPYHPRTFNRLIDLAGTGGKRKNE